jgi:preprotein translocase SecE subunit
MGSEVGMDFGDESKEAHQIPTVPVTKKRRLFGYIEGIKEELKKVSWTTREELKLSTKVVILATFVFGFAIYCVDFVVKGALDLIGLMARMLFG